MSIHVNVRPRLRHDNRARMIANGAGDAFVAWADDRDGGQDTCAQRMNTKGAFVGQQNGDLVTDRRRQRPGRVAAGDLRVRAGGDAEVVKPVRIR